MRHYGISHRKTVSVVDNVTINSDNFKTHATKDWKKNKLIAVDRINYLDYVSRFSHNGRVAQWITRLPTEQKIPGSNPGALNKVFLILSNIFTIMQKY